MEPFDGSGLYEYYKGPLHRRYCSRSDFQMTYEATGEKISGSATCADAYAPDNKTDSESLAQARNQVSRWLSMLLVNKTFTGEMVSWKSGPPMSVRQGTKLIIDSPYQPYKPRRRSALIMQNGSSQNSIMMVLIAILPVFMGSLHQLFFCYTLAKAF